MNLPGRLRLAALFASLACVLLLTVEWAYEALRPWRDQADANEALWGTVSGVLALWAIVTAWPSRHRHRRAAWTLMAIAAFVLLAWLAAWALTWLLAGDE